MKTFSRALAAAVVTALVGTLAPAATAAPPEPALTDATYFNSASQNAADPFVLFDEASGYYYAYSTDGADRGWDFGIYRSADLSTWEHVPGGALSQSDPKRWGKDWFWAPEVYHNDKTGLYYFFYAARMQDDVQQTFGYADFEEPSKVGVAVSTSPAGPFHNISDEPIDYWPYDPDYRDVNLIMDATQRKPPATREEGETAPLGTYIPFIDPNVFFDDDGRVYLYYSRNAYRNWVWDTDLGKYIEESNIYAVELTADWWNDPTGTTMPSITPAYKNANVRPGAPEGARRDGFTPVVNYGSDKQAWENAHVNDYTVYVGQKKDRRWSEGSTTVKHYVNGKAVYYLLYSANNWENENYGVGYATADSPLGPWRKFEGNPVLSKNAALPMYGTGHGSVIASPDGSELYYVHHGRPGATSGPRKLYTERMTIDDAKPDANGNPTLSIDQTTADRPVPSGVGPFSITAGTATKLEPGEAADVAVTVKSAPGAALPLTDPLNRVTALVADPAVATATVSGGTVRVTANSAGTTQVTVTYQRQQSSGAYVDVHNLTEAGATPVAVTFTVVVHPTLAQLRATVDELVTGKHVVASYGRDLRELLDTAEAAQARGDDGAVLAAVRQLSGVVTAARPAKVDAYARQQLTQLLGLWLA
ncbi:family 43 glycosylhydrolase [Motilibacter deserti]|uniref:family 43 glycosylhydrolase n=1 Tax=Motilibacter deserti TaxID=2714956 RepID=UPI002F2B329A